MKHYIIDGNNLIGKIKTLSKLQRKDKQASRVKMAFMIDNHFAGKRANITIHFDGFAKDVIRTSKCKLVYSDKQTADEKIKEQISLSNNRKNLILVTSDRNLAQFARVCSCNIITGENFANEMAHELIDKEDSIIDKLKNDSGEFKRLFGVDDN